MLKSLLKCMTNKTCFKENLSYSIHRSTIMFYDKFRYGLSGWPLTSLFSPDSNCCSSIGKGKTDNSYPLTENGNGMRDVNNSQDNC